MRLRFFIWLFALFLTGCGLDSHSCLDEILQARMRALKKSYIATLNHNQLKGNRDFLMQYLASREKQQIKPVIIPNEARISDIDISYLNKILRNNEGAYSQGNDYVTCIKNSELGERTIIQKYVATKEKAGNIAPEFMAEGFYSSAEGDDLTNELITEMILLEVYLPLLSRESVENAR